MSDLPDMSHEVLEADPSLPSFHALPLQQLSALVDAAHTTDLKTQSSVTGLVILFAGAPIAYKSGLQLTVSTSSTEAEFIAAMACAKLVKYFQTILDELGWPQTDPTIIQVDNQAAINMVNKKRPTLHSCPIDVQHFAGMA